MLFRQQTNLFTPIQEVPVSCAYPEGLPVEMKMNRVFDIQTETDFLSFLFLLHILIRG